ncbi:carboxypeptidase-like regulatory domain-containing protein [Sediminibacterium roseum]|uniref:Carboxypeptidase-like regulatory domain-containing protein n=1 Tax=Sediminibacterium roseum TaxID=1978412 RepID=A0ABW9ZZW7_9BACT|nr:carboxypeptidase-like regulatory domain-containing protein [Sediminibacterium roseum]NCI51237.1 carboxypeptidase-like regulatory domain-containing protein [Sediminibacterium roseum]
MKKPLRYILLGITLLALQQVRSQENNPYRDSVVQLYGVVMTADSLQGIPSCSVIVEGKGRGTVTSYDGVFSIAVLKGDKITFSSVGFKDRSILIPHNLEGNQYSVIQLLVTDTAYLPATILKPRPSREQFERDFVNVKISDDLYETARKNTDEATRRILIRSMPADGREAVNYQLRQQATKAYYSGQVPPMNILNPAAWADFIQAWKRGDFKSKN